MGRVKFTLTNIWFWAILGVTCFLCENVPLIYSQNLRRLEGFTFTSLGILSIILILMFVVYFVLEHKRNKVKLDWILGPILLILCVCGIIGIWTTSSYMKLDSVLLISYEIDIPVRLRIISTIETIFTYLFLYAFLFMYTKGFLTKKRLVFFAYVYVLFVIVAITYSLFKEFPSYQRFFSTEPTPKNTHNIFSFFTHPNLFCFCIMIGVFALICIKAHKFRWWIYPLMALFCLEAFVVRSTTTFFILFAVVFFSVVIDIVSLWKKKPIAGVIVLSSIILVFIGLIITLLVLNYLNVPFIKAFYKHLNNAILAKDYGTFTNRTLTWKLVGTILDDNKLNWIFGVGKVINKHVIVSIYEPRGITIASAHNGYIELMLKGGIVLCAAYALALLYYIYVCIRLLAKGHVKYVFSYFICFLGCLTHSFMESTHFFGSSISCIIETLIVFLPPVLLYKNLYKHKEIREDVKTGNYWQGSLSSSSLTKGVAMIISSLLLVTLFTYIIYKNRIDASILPLVELVIIVLGISLFFIPYQMGLWYKSSSGPGYYFALISWFIIYFVLAPGFVVGMYYLTGVKATSLFVYLRNLTPFIIAGLMCLSLFTSVLTKYGNPIKMLKDTLLGIFALGGIPSIFMILTLLLGIVYLKRLPYYEWLDVYLIDALAITVFYVVFMMINFPNSRTVKEEVNLNALYYKRRAIMKEDFRYEQDGVN